jgi:hypothetical protein
MRRVLQTIQMMEGFEAHHATRPEIPLEFVDKFGGDIPKDD